MIKEIFAGVSSWWQQDVQRRWLLVGGFLYAWFLGQGIPLWDDDFTSWFWKIKDQSIWTTLWQWISPISTQPQFWGFNERPVQALVYQLCYLISGYESWSYFLYKGAVYAGLGVMAYMWGLKLLPKKTRGARYGAAAAAAFLLLAPGPAAAHVIHSDLATTAEFLFLALTYWIFNEVEKTPTSWRGIPSFSNAEHRSWMGKWLLIAFCVYLGYKSKADLKLIPAIVAAYIFLVRRKQIGFFAWPVGWMVLLAVPWGGAIFQKLPPFVPGSAGSEIGWMWQPASMSRLLHFIWTPGTYSPLAALKDPTLSLAGLLGPYLLVGILAFMVWAIERSGGLTGFSLSGFNRAIEKPESRARTFAWIWFLGIMVGVSALPEINYIFRVRYGIITLVPVTLILAWALGRFAEAAMGEEGRRLPAWAAVAGVLLFSVQAGANLTRSITYRRDLGQVMIAVDQVYEQVAKNHGSEALALFPDFRPYDYRPDAPQAIINRTWLGKPEEISKFQPYKAYAISWKPSLWQGLEVVGNFSGCREGVLFDKLFPCPAGTGAFLMRYIGEDPLYVQAEAARNKGDIATARKLHDEFLSKHPGSLAGQFVTGLMAYQAQDWTRAQQAYSMLERYLPDHLSVLYNHALVLAQLKQFDASADRLRYIATREPANYAAQINLYWAYTKGGREKEAKRKIAELKKMFPADTEVAKLAGG